MMGTVSDVAGTFSATISMKTENATKHVKPKVTFSPDDVGNLEMLFFRIFLFVQYSLTKMTYMSNMRALHME